MTIIGIAGLGEVGNSIYKLYEKSKFTIRVKDPAKNLDESFNDVQVLHICFPFFSPDQFTKCVIDLINKNSIKYTVIHSTVCPGTTKKIQEQIGDNLICHSPIRGIHPHLYDSLFIFNKYIGTDSEELGSYIKQHLESLGVEVNIVPDSKTTEVMKILSTTQYGFQIAIAQELKRVCDYFSVDYYTAINHCNKTYNIGYEKLDKPQFKRPTLIPLSEFKGHNHKDDCKIGGHCVCENLEILLKELPKEYHSTFDLIKKYSKFE